MKIEPYNIYLFREWIILFKGDCDNGFIKVPVFINKDRKWEIPLLVDVRREQWDRYMYYDDDINTVTKEQIYEIYTSIDNTGKNHLRNMIVFCWVNTFYSSLPTRIYSEMKWVLSIFDDYLDKTQIKPHQKNKLQILFE